jgi:hypothetical protein
MPLLFDYITLNENWSSAIDKLNKNLRVLEEKFGPQGKTGNPGFVGLPGKKGGKGSPGDNGFSDKLIIIDASEALSFTTTDISVEYYHNILHDKMTVLTLDEVNLLNNPEVDNTTDEYINAVEKKKRFETSIKNKNINVNLIIKGNTVIKKLVDVIYSDETPTVNMIWENDGTLLNTVTSNVEGFVIKPKTGINKPPTAENLDFLTTSYITYGLSLVNLSMGGDKIYSIRKINGSENQANFRTLDVFRENFNTGVYGNNVFDYDHKLLLINNVSATEADVSYSPLILLGNVSEDVDFDKDTGLPADVINKRKLFASAFSMGVKKENETNFVTTHELLLASRNLSGLTTSMVDTYNLGLYFDSIKVYNKGGSKSSTLSVNTNDILEFSTGILVRGSSVIQRSGTTNPILTLRKDATYGLVFNNSNNIYTIAPNENTQSILFNLGVASNNTLFLGSGNGVAINKNTLNTNTRLDIALTTANDYVLIKNTDSNSNTSTVFQIDSLISQLNTFRVQRNGRVGVNISEALETLHVNGSIRSTGYKIDSNEAINSSRNFFTHQEYNFGTTNNTGFVSSTNNTIDVKTANSIRFRYDASGNFQLVSGTTYTTLIDTNRRFFANDSNTVGTPSYSFNNDFDTGMYRVADNSIGFSAGNKLMLNITNTKLLANSGYTPTDDNSLATKKYMDDHSTSDGSSHTFIDQNVTTNGAPSFVRLGIGTNSVANTALYINNYFTSQTAFFGNTGTGHGVEINVANSSVYALLIRRGGNWIFNVASNGNIGIGTEADLTTLDNLVTIQRSLSYYLLSLNNLSTTGHGLNINITANDQTRNALLITRGSTNILRLLSSGRLFLGQPTASDIFNEVNILNIKSDIGENKYLVKLNNTSTGGNTLFLDSSSIEPSRYILNVKEYFKVSGSGMSYFGDLPLNDDNAFTLVNMQKSIPDYILKVRNTNTQGSGIDIKVAGNGGKYPLYISRQVNTETPINLFSVDDTGRVNIGSLVDRQTNSILNIRDTKQSSYLMNLTNNHTSGNGLLINLPFSRTTALYITNTDGAVLNITGNNFIFGSTTVTTKTNQKMSISGYQNSKLHINSTNTSSESTTSHLRFGLNDSASRGSEIISRSTGVNGTNTELEFWVDKSNTLVKSVIINDRGIHGNYLYGEVTPLTNITSSYFPRMTFGQIKTTGGTGRRMGSIIIPLTISKETISGQMYTHFMDDLPGDIAVVRVVGSYLSRASDTSGTEYIRGGLDIFYNASIPLGPAGSFINIGSADSGLLFNFQSNKKIRIQNSAKVTDFSLAVHIYITYYY